MRMSRFRLKNLYQSQAVLILIENLFSPHYLPRVQREARGGEVSQHIKIQRINPPSPAGPAGQRYYHHNCNTRPPNRKRKREKLSILLRGGCYLAGSHLLAYQSVLATGGAAASAATVHCPLSRPFWSVGEQKGNVQKKRKEKINKHFKSQAANASSVNQQAVLFLGKVGSNC